MAKKDTTKFRKTPQCGCHEKQNQIDEEAESMQHADLNILYKNYEQENAYLKAESKFIIKNASEENTIH